MFLLFDMQEEWTCNISNKYFNKSDVCIKLKYIWISSLDIYQHIFYHAESKKGRNQHINYENTPNA